MSEHSIKCSSDGICSTRQDSAYWNDQVWPFTCELYTPAASLCKVETATRLLKFFSSSLSECL